MMDLHEIERLSKDATRNARKSNLQPYFQSYDGATGKIPFLGDYVPKGWRRTEREPLFVDISGFGSPDEAALTTKQMFAAFMVGKGYALIERGQFQGYVAEYEQANRGSVGHEEEGTPPEGSDDGE